MRPLTLLLFGAACSAAASAAPVKGDVVRGEQIYTRCFACHALDRDRTGPRHCGLFGRKAGSVPGFDYSSAMKKSGIVWNEKTLNLVLANPAKTVPGTSMGYDGVKDSQERSDLIAYLKKATQPGGANCP